jgi:hypothetical protein
LIIEEDWNDLFDKMLISLNLPSKKVPKDLSSLSNIPNYQFFTNTQEYLHYSKPLYEYVLDLFDSFFNSKKLNFSLLISTILCDVDNIIFILELNQDLWVPYQELLKTFEYKKLFLSLENKFNL